MSFYKLESTFDVVKSDNRKYPYRSKKTYKYFYDNYDSVVTTLRNNLALKGKVTVRTISQSEYIHGLER